MLSFGRGAPYLEKKSRVPTVGEGLRARRFGPARRAAHSHGENSIIGLKKVSEENVCFYIKGAPSRNLKRGRCIWGHTLDGNRSVRFL
jgi:hypothetical protein